MKRAAAIDIGSQTIRLLVADAAGKPSLKPVQRSRAIIRLGESMQETGCLQIDAMNRAVQCIADFAAQAGRHGASIIYPIATACVRHADNAAFFLNSVFSATGLRPQVLTGQEEALLSLRGIQSVYSTHPGRALIVDIGGGSTEFCLTAGLTAVQTESIPMGVIALSERYLAHDPPLPSEIGSLKETIRRRLEVCIRGFKDLLPGQSNLALIGTAGTLTTLAAMDLQLSVYDPGAINGHRLRQRNLKQLFERMLGLTSARRAQIPGLEAGRSIVILPGALIVLTLLDLFRHEEILVSDAGLLEGVLLSKMAGIVDR